MALTTREQADNEQLESLLDSPGWQLVVNEIDRRLVAAAGQASVRYRPGQETLEEYGAKCAERAITIDVLRMVKKLPMTLKKQSNKGEETR